MVSNIFKSNLSMKFDQVIGYNKIFFFKNHAENEGGKLVPDLFLFFKKAFYEVKESGLELDFDTLR